MTDPLKNKGKSLGPFLTSQDANHTSETGKLTKQSSSALLKKTGKRECWTIKNSLFLGKRQRDSKGKTTGSPEAETGENKTETWISPVTGRQRHQKLNMKGAIHSSTNG